MSVSFLSLVLCGCYGGEQLPLPYIPVDMLYLVTGPKAMQVTMD
jgi:hypothetical protein